MVMQDTEKSTTPVWWFRLGLIGILLVSLGLRFWGLGRFNTLVFDEVYYAKFANNYLTNTPFFDGHPPLSKYLIAIGIWIGNRLPIGRDSVNFLTGSALTTWSYRWLNALTGSFIPLVISAIAYALSQRRSFALIAGTLAAMDGLFLVESRYALNNVYLVIFGLLGQWFVLLSLRFVKSTTEKPARRKWILFLSLAGVFFGASISIKWNGLWFLFSIYLLWGIGWLFRLINRINQSPKSNEFNLENSGFRTPLYRLTQINFFCFLLCLAVIPFIFYWLIWIPHIHLDPRFGFIEVQRQILVYHKNVGSGKDIHPYCSNWYSWILMMRTVAYFYRVGNRDEDPTLHEASLPLTPDRVIYDVHAMGNPFLWWFSSAAIGLLIWTLLDRWKQLPTLTNLRSSLNSSPASHDLWTGLFIVTSYGANLLPWVGVTRCVFLYHYMGASVYAGLALAWFVDRWFRSRDYQVIGLSVMLIVAGAFIFWMPIYLGLPLTKTQYQMRIWFEGWL
jgi:dolichyl-phosphate-mannose-protein mannosyltransferase